MYSHTYVLSIGRKTMNHQLVLDEYVTELKTLAQCAYKYNGTAGCNVPTVVQVLAFLCDYPERCAVTCIQSYAGLSTRRWLYSAYINSTKMPSCNNCLRKRIKRMGCNTTNSGKVTVCNMCCDWDFESSSMALRVRTPTDYPTTQHVLSPKPPICREIVGIQFLIPVKMTFLWLIEGCRFCFFNVLTRTWSLASAMSYCKALGLKESFAKTNIIQRANSLPSIHIKRIPTY